MTQPTQQTTDVLPNAGPFPSEMLAVFVAATPEMIGASDWAELRSVRALREDRWTNVGTVLFIGPERREIPPADHQAGELRLLARSIRLRDIGAQEDLEALFTVWPGVDEDSPGALQSQIYPARENSGEGAGFPGWRVNLHFNPDPLRYEYTQSFQNPFFNAEIGFFAADLGHALNSWLLVPGIVSTSGNHSEYTILISDARARFTRVDLNEQSISVKVERSPEMQKAVLYFAAEFSGFASDRWTQVVPISDDLATMTSPEEFRSVAGYLLGDHGGWIDRFREPRVHLPTFSTASGTRSKATEEPDLIQTMLADRDAGEGETIEFKEWLPPTAEHAKQKDLLKTVSAFANFRGGRLYVGIDDDGVICGLSKALAKAYRAEYGNDQKQWCTSYVRRLKQTVGEGIAPEVRLRFDWIEFSGDTVLRITVPVGAPPSHELLATRQTYIRRNATSRLLSASEAATIIEQHRTSSLGELNSLFARRR